MVMIPIQYKAPFGQGRLGWPKLGDSSATISEVTVTATVFFLFFLFLFLVLLFFFIC